MGFDGFDGVELLMTVEHVFGISISDREAEKIQTPGELTDYLIGRISARPDDQQCRCIGAASFYRARRILVKRFGLDPATIRPQKPTEEILPIEASGRREFWCQLKHAFGVRLPALQHSKRLQSIAGGIGFLFLLAGLAAAPIFVLSRTHAVAVAWGLILAGIFVPYIIRAALRCRATHIPAGYETVGRISSELAGPEIEQLWQKKSEWTKHQVWEFVRWSTAKSARVSPASIHRDTSFVRL